MLTDPVLKSKVDSLWDKLWSGGLSNPLDAIEQFSFLLFLKRLEEGEEDRERRARHRKEQYKPVFKDSELRWSYWTNLKAEEALKLVKERVFPFVKTLGGEGGSFAEQMVNAEFKINKPSLLIEACKMIDQIQISSQNQDVQGDLYEYLLSKLNTAGTNGQFRTPRHIIRMMVKMLGPRPGERMCDPAAGTCGFPVNVYQHILETHTRPANLIYDEDGFPHGLIGEKLTKEQHQFLQSSAITAFDNDSGMTMLRIGSMNLMLHGIEQPHFTYADTLSKAFTEEKRYDIILANPPFKGAIDSSDVNPTLPTRIKKTEVLFLHLFLRLLEVGGRAAVIVPDGVLSGTSNAHSEIRTKLIEENRLDAVVSMPAGVFRPYAGVSTAVLVFTKGGTTDNIWFYDMEHDGFSLDDKRQKTEENDIPDILLCWTSAKDLEFNQQRAQRLSKLTKDIAPLKSERLVMHQGINRLRYERTVATVDSPDLRLELEADEKRLSQLSAKIAPLQNEINQLGRQFRVPKEQVKANQYRLSASLYRQMEQDETFYEKPGTTIERLMKLEQIAMESTAALKEMMK